MTSKAQPRCPECTSQRLYRNGLRYLADGSTVQRWLCRECGYRFSESGSTRSNKPEHVQKSHSSALNSADPYLVSSQICAAETKGAKNLARGNQKQTLKDGLSAEATEFASQLKRDGYSPYTIKACTRLLARLERNGVNPLKPEQVKAWISEHEWNNHSKATFVAYYGVFAKYMHLQWSPPRYRYEQKVPFIPLESEVNDLLAGTGRIMSLFLRILVETGCRCGEALRLRWQDFDASKGTLAINNPEKGSAPRILPVSNKLKEMLNRRCRKGNRIFTSSMNTMQTNFRQQRRRIAAKLGNPRLNQIHFHTLRHYYATMLFAKTLNLLKVQKALGHRNINSTMIYTHLIDFKSEEYEVHVALTVDDAKKLGEAGFEHYDTIGDSHLYRRRK